MQQTSRPITFAASDELIEALDEEAFHNDQTRAATIREIVGEYLRKHGSLSTKAPLTTQLGRTNPNYAGATR